MYDPPRILLLLEHDMVKQNITELPPVVCFYVGLIAEREDELFQFNSTEEVPRYYQAMAPGC